MSDYLLAATLGLVEGLTEFLPVSSTAHLRITEAILGIDLQNSYWAMFSIVIQAGAILSLPIYFWSTLREYFTDFPRGPRGDRSFLTHPITLVGIAFVFTSVPALLLQKLIGKNLESLRIMAWSLLIGGVVMWVVDVAYAPERRPPRTEQLDRITPLQSVWVGLCQALAPIFPGTSRSMATISGGQLAGMSRSLALEFSFLLSIPTMLAATGFDFLRFIRAGGGTSASLDGHGIALLIIGGLVSFVVASLSVAWLLHWVRRHGFVPFAVYRIIAGVALLLFSSR